MKPFLRENGLTVTILFTFNLFTLLFMFCVNIWTTNLIKSSLSQQLFEESRNNIVSSDFRALLTSLKSRTKSDFIEIKILSDDGKLLNRFSRSDTTGGTDLFCNGIASGQFEYAIFYDDQHKIPFGKIIFVYERVTSLVAILTAWLGLLLLSIPLSVPLKRQIKAKMARDMERHRLTVIAQTTQMIAHDLKNPINTIQDALNCSDWEQFRRRSPGFKSALYRLLSMVESLRHADLDSLVHVRLIRLPWDQIMCEMAPFAQQKGVTLHLGETLADEIKIDADKVQRAILNLLRNAIECGSRNVWLSAEVGGADVIITVKDDGPGVHDSIKAKIFERGVTYGKREGTGLGLQFVRSVARGHGGECDYIREKGLSVFSMTLPNAAGRSVVIPSKSIDGSHMERCGDSAPPVRGIAIMLQDGTMEKRVSAEIMLKKPDSRVINDREHLHHAEILFTDDNGLAVAAVKRGIAIVPVDAEADLKIIVQTITNQFS